MAYEINININTESGDINTSGISGVAGGGKSTSDASKDLSSKLGKYVATQTIQPFIQQTLNFATSNVELTTGSTELQQRIDLAKQGVSLGIEAFKNAQAGAVITSGLGLGSGVGFGIGIALTALNVGMDILFKEKQIQTNRAVESRQRSYLINRAGAAFSQSRRGL